MDVSISPAADISWNSHKITSLADPAAAQDAATKNWCETSQTASALTSLGAQAENLNMNSHQIDNVTDPTAAQDAATKKYVDDNFGATSPPVGAIIAWLKSYTNTPQTLPSGWVECAGQTLDDADSVYDEQVIPDLNGGEFLRGSSTSGGTGGSETHSHTIDAHEDSKGTGTSVEPYVRDSSTNETSTLPTYYNVVWIMRIK